MFLEKILKLGKNALKHREINDFGPGGQFWKWILKLFLKPQPVNLIWPK